MCEALQSTLKVVSHADGDPEEDRVRDIMDVVTCLRGHRCCLDSCPHFAGVGLGHTLIEFMTSGPLERVTCA